MQIAIPAILAAFIILFLHWFPWHLLRGEKLGRLTAYTLGTVVIVGVMDATDDLILYVRGMRRRGLDADEYEWLLDRIGEIRRDALRLEAMIDGGGR